MFTKASAIYHEYPTSFWTVVVVNFIDKLGESLLYPFFALYLTRQFSVDMTQVGLLLAVFSGAGFLGGFPGGVLSDRLGRKSIIIFSLLSSSFSDLLLGVARSFNVFAIVAFIAGMFSQVGGPSYEAIIADLLPEEKRAQGYGVRRVAFNLAVVVGPVIGGFLATRSYMSLFIADAVISTIAAAVVFFYLQETRPQQAVESSEEQDNSFGGYGRVFRNGSFMMFLLISTLAWLVYININTTLGVYLRDQHGIFESGYGWILSLNAAMVVLFQFWITRRLEKQPPMLMMALGTLLLAGGFALYGFVAGYGAFLLAMAVVTVGEMICFPVSSALSVTFAPADMRGRYSYIYDLSWGIAYMLGPYLAGVIMDASPNWLWYACGIVGVLAAGGYLLLYMRTRPNTAQMPSEV